MHKLLIANRGEIACRIIRTAHRLGLATVAIHSEADARALHVRTADEAVAIDADDAAAYRDGAAILAAADATGADAIHPGYGFLSEIADFAEAVTAAGLCFVGPSAEAMRQMGPKDSAKARMKAAGVPIVPGYMGEDQGLARMERMAELVGYPLLVKAVAGGGGRGLRRVDSRADFTEALIAAKREAQAAFGNDSVMLEKLILRPRHIEVQIFGDAHGNFVHLGERDCSVQRRHQKLIEEAPASGLSERLRHILGVAAVTAGVAVGYRNAGTVEFILDMDEVDEDGDPAFYFLEMNTRLQVEHPVTESVTGLDLVEWQLRIAAGEMLPLMQDAIDVRGHAVEARLCAEIPARGFLPSSGTITRFDLPGGVRVDSGYAAGDAVPVQYDSLLAKLVAHGQTRSEAIDRLVRALDALLVEGVETNRAWLARLLSAAAFRAGPVDTGFVDRHAADLVAQPSDLAWPAAVAAAHLWAGGDGRRAAAPESAVGFAEPFRLNLPLLWHGALYDNDGRGFRTALVADASGSDPAVGQQNVRVSIDGGPELAVVIRQTGAGTEALVGGAVYPVTLVESDGGVGIRSRGQDWTFLRDNPRWGIDEGSATIDGRILAPMAGRVLSLGVAAGQAVARGDLLLVLEAMKMEHRLLAPSAGVVAELATAAGQQVAEGALLVRIEDAP